MAYKSSYPPQFSSTLKYENRYDLDEIDVFLEGNANNPMFFNVSGLPQNLSYGKHYFYLSILDSKYLQNIYNKKIESAPPDTAKINLSFLISLSRTSK